MQISDHQRDRVRGAFMGALLGDARGMPVEAMKPKEVAALNGGRGVIDFMDPVPRKGAFHSNHLKAGDTTDDWQLTAAVARSLIRTRGKLDILDCAQEHVRELETTKVGWGGTTYRAIEDIRNGKRNPLTDTLPPAEAGQGEGNGVMMKIMPVATVYALRPSTMSGMDPLARDCLSLGAITHPGRVPSITAYAIALIIKRALKFEFDDEEEAFDFVRGYVSRDLWMLEMHDLLGTPTVYGRLKLIYPTLHDPYSLRNIPGYMRFHCMYTLTLTIGTFLRHPTDFAVGIDEIINHGGDADSNASILGAMIGANVGLTGIPYEWQKFRPWYTQAIELADQLIDAL